MHNDINPDSKLTILVVDDERSNLAMLNMILCDEYEIITAKTGEAALLLAVEARPDLILLDIILPDINGFDVLVKLKEDPTTQKIPVIFITGLNSESDEEKGLRLGAVDYIQKPFKNVLVKARVNTHIEMQWQMRVVEQLGLIDPLTGIPNRRSFDDRLEMEWRRAIREKKPISFLMIDIDRFKIYNDTYGHPQGDTLLKAVARIFKERAKRPGDLSARLGGEEFGILLPDTGMPSALSIAEKIHADVESLRAPTADGTEITSTTISIGVASVLPGKHDLASDFIFTADKNLYTAKTSGRNKVCW
jgi:diguanylate cyclase (GGDEF)-like protein